MYTAFIGLIHNLHTRACFVGKEGKIRFGKREIIEWYGFHGATLWDLLALLPLLSGFPMHALGGTEDSIIFLITGTLTILL